MSKIVEEEPIVLENTKDIFIIDFWTYEWGPAYEMLKRTSDNITADFNGDPVEVVYVNVDRVENLKWANYYKATLIPTFMIRFGGIFVCL
jgi:hypothetical protein